MIFGRQGYLKGLLGRNNFYALRIIDKHRQREYTPWRNLVPSRKREKAAGAVKSHPSGENLA